MILTGGVWRDRLRIGGHFKRTEVFDVPSQSILGISFK